MIGMPTDEEAEILVEAEKVSEESKVHDPVRHPFKYPADWVALEQYNGSRSIIENE